MLLFKINQGVSAYFRLIKLRKIGEISITQALCCNCSFQIVDPIWLLLLTTYMITVRRGSRILFTFGKLVLEGIVTRIDFETNKLLVALDDLDETYDSGMIFMIPFADIIDNWQIMEPVKEKKHTHCWHFTLLEVDPFCCLCVALSKLLEPTKENPNVHDQRKVSGN